MTERIPLSGPSDWAEETAAILRNVTPAAQSGDGEGPPNILFTLGHHPALLPPFLGFTSAIALRGVLTRRESEILALRASWNCRSRFEWGHHAEYGLAAGLSAEQVEAIAEGPDAAIWDAADRLLLLAADALHAQHDWSDALYAELAARFNHAQIVEITFVVGNYTMLSMVANATRVPLEARLPAMPEPQ